MRCEIRCVGCELACLARRMVPQCGALDIAFSAFGLVKNECFALADGELNTFQSQLCLLELVNKYQLQVFLGRFRNDEKHFLKYLAEKCM